MTKLTRERYEESWGYHIDELSRMGWDLIEASKHCDEDLFAKLFDIQHELKSLVQQAADHINFEELK